MIRAPKRDFGTLDTVGAVAAPLAAMTGGPESVAEVVLAAFDAYHARFALIPELAKRAFEARDWAGAVALSQERLAIFSISLEELGRVIGPVPRDVAFWAEVGAAVDRLVADRYEADLARAYFAALRRGVIGGAWAAEWFDHPRVESAADFVARFRPGAEMTAECVAEILQLPEIDAPFADLVSDAAAVAARIRETLPGALGAVEIVRAGFYRNRGAYIVGALEVAGVRHPLALALLHRPEGLIVDAVILKGSTMSHLFSSTLANFHVDVPQYHALVDFLHRLMPGRPHGQHYSTIGYNHVGKIAVYRQIMGEMAGAVFDHAPGPRGSVALGFTAPDLPFVLKLIRDRPTDQYKWGAFEGRAAVLAKYGIVHEYNRSGSMLDNIMYTDIALPAALFAEGFLAELLVEAGESVRREGADLVFAHLIVQRKLVPMPIFLEQCSAEDAEVAVIRLGQCIRNNAAMNVFNRDLDLRNYGVSSLRFVYLFEYDAVEPLTEVDVFTNAGREEGEEDVPDWFFESGPVFLPEELETHLRLPGRGLRRLFREAHGELLTKGWWDRMKGWLAEGRVPRVRTYPISTQLRGRVPPKNLSLESLASD
ncbi:MAG: isocitrate dehydrogenase kinase/phosphatase AceK regulatory subunit [Pseudomonadota bacterium]